MERAPHRIRNIPTQQLVQEAVADLLRWKAEGDTSQAVQLRASRLYRELARRTDLPPLKPLECTCADCLGDLFDPDPGPGPFDSR